MDVDSYLRDAVGRAVPMPTREGDWPRVLADSGEQRQHRFGRRRVKWGVLLAAAIGCSVVVAAPATGVRSAIANIFADSDPAPANVVRDFGNLDARAPEGMDSEVIGGEARQVAAFQRADGSTTRFFVAPTAKGGYCLTVEGSSTDCIDPSVSNDQGQPFDLVTRFADSRAALLTGSLLSTSGATQVVALHEDGSRTALETVWVSAPIGAGFFLYDIPSEERVSGHRVIALVGLDETGNEVARVEVSTDAG